MELFRVCGNLNRKESFRLPDKKRKPEDQEPLIRIPKEGQKTYSYLENHILKLGDKTLANSIPSLKIDANDVKASHGATVGQIDEEHMFYLMSRGLTEEIAKNLIIQGFLDSIIGEFPKNLADKARKNI